LPSPQAVEEVVLGEDGVFEGLNAGAGLIDTSTNAPAVMRHIAEIGVSKGIHVLDGPISGGVFGARDGTLTVFIGGEKAHFERYKPLLECIGKNIVYMGPSGCGNVTKLVNNMMMFVNFVGACEGMAIGAKAGIDPNQLLEVITPSMGQSIMMERCMRLFLKGETLYSSTDLAVKDMHLGVELGKEVDVPMVISPMVEEMFTRFRGDDRGQDDILEFIGDFMARSGVSPPRHEDAKKSKD
jgi:3-hydroxyisobutyrate dehydrogenase-like beta-hydroxyacid dehydrogenase